MGIYMPIISALRCKRRINIDFSTSHNIFVPCDLQSSDIHTYFIRHRIQPNTAIWTHLFSEHIVAAYTKIPKMCVVYTNYYICGHIRGTTTTECPNKGSCLPDHRDGTTSTANCGAPICNTPPSDY